jgi:uncharacterized protein YqjF (DUF2071 family)
MSQHSALAHLAHRPWALPSSPWVWRQNWCDLLFAHWPAKAADLQRFVPAPLEVQEFDGTSWVGLVPFRMSGVMRRPLPDLPWISAFPELNVRLYVEHTGKPGVWFLSLDATNALAVWAARRHFHLPYYRADMELAQSVGSIVYTSTRRGGGPQLEARYRPTSAPYASHAGTLEHWLTERYCLYAQAPDGRLYRTDVHHAPWPLQHAEAELSRNTYLASHGLDLPGPPALLHFARRIDVVAWNPEQVAVGSRSAAPGEGRS